MEQKTMTRRQIRAALNSMYGNEPLNPHDPNDLRNYSYKDVAAILMNG